MKIDFSNPEVWKSLEKQACSGTIEPERFAHWRKPLPMSALKKINQAGLPYFHIQQSRLIFTTVFQSPLTAEAWRNSTPETDCTPSGKESDTVLLFQRLPSGRKCRVLRKDE